MTEYYSCENAQSLMDLHFSSSVLAAYELKECPAGQPATQPDSVLLHLPLAAPGLRLNMSTSVQFKSWASSLRDISTEQK